MSSSIKVAIVHDYIKEYGGAERVVEELHKLFPDAPIYTAFYKEGSTAYARLKGAKIIPSWVHYIPFFADKLHSPLRFLTPLIWASFDFSKYDVVISSASWYVTKGFGSRKSTPAFSTPVSLRSQAGSLASASVRPSGVKRDYYLVVGRIVGSKGLDLAVEAAAKLGIKIKIVGLPAGYYTGYKSLSKKAEKNVEFLGHVRDEELAKLYSGAKAFLALAEDEDFGMTPVEAMLSGTPVIAYYGGGYKESVIDEKTGLFFREYTLDSLVDAIKKFESLKISSETCRKQAQKFSSDVFDKKILDFIKGLK